MKKWIVNLFLAVLVIGISFTNVLDFGVGQALNIVEGVIDSDIVWTVKNSPYALSGNIAIPNGITLTIEPGVTVNLNNFYIQVNGTLNAKGSSTDKIFFNGSILSEIIFNPSSTNSLIENAMVNASLQINKSSPVIHRNVIMLGTTVNGGSPIISQNTIEISILSDWVGRQTYRSTAIDIGGENTAVISDNIISGSLEKAAISISSGLPIIARNNISNSYGYAKDTTFWQSGISLYGYCSPIIKDNTITKSAVGIFIYGSSNPTIVSNNINGNSNYNLRLDTQSNMAAFNNWWGTADSTVIDQKIYDINDDFSVGKIDYVPFLADPNPYASPDLNAPIPTPFPTVNSPPTSTPILSLQPSQSLTATPIQPITGTSVLLSLNFLEIAIGILLFVVVVLLIIIIVSLRRRI